MLRVFLTIEIHRQRVEVERDRHDHAVEDVIYGALDDAVVHRQLKINRQTGRIFDGGAHDVETADGIRLVNFRRTGLLIGALPVAFDFRRTDIVIERDGRKRERFEVEREYIDRAFEVRRVGRLEGFAEAKE